MLTRAACCKFLSDRKKSFHPLVYFIPLIVLRQCLDHDGDVYVSQFYTKRCRHNHQ